MESLNVCRSTTSWPATFSRIRACRRIAGPGVCRRAGDRPGPQEPGGCADRRAPGRRAGGQAPGLFRPSRCVSGAPRASSPATESETGRSRVLPRKEAGRFDEELRHAGRSGVPQGRRQRAADGGTIFVPFDALGTGFVRDQKLLLGAPRPLTHLLHSATQSARNSLIRHNGTAPSMKM